MNPAIPDRFLERYEGITDDRKAFLSSLERPLGWAFRVNALKAERETVMRRFGEYGIRFEPSGFWDLAFRTDQDSVSRTVEYFLGHVYIQELVSMLPPLILRQDLPKEPLLLDACAAPGSKTTQLSELLGNGGMIIANDADYNRIKALKHNVEKTGSMNTVIINRDIRYYEQQPVFDGILLDAPCSGEGTIRKNPNAMARWSEKAIRSLSGMQKRMILNCFGMLKPGSSMVYSTCTYAPEENEEVVDYLLEKRGCRIERITLKGMKSSQGLAGYGKREFNKDVRNAVRIWPHQNDTGGFFMAKIRKPRKSG